MSVDPLYSRLAGLVVVLLFETWAHALWHTALPHNGPVLWSKSTLAHFLGLISGLAVYGCNRKRVDHLSSCVGLVVFGKSEPYIA